jgi:hypothetical protein
VRKKDPGPELSDKNVKLGAQAHRATIKVLNKQIEAIEAAILKRLKPIPEYHQETTVSCDHASSHANDLGRRRKTRLFVSAH